MCRLVAVVGEPMLVADVVLWPRHSIIKQSYDARERLRDPSLPMHLGFGNLNGDGFGIGWYAPEAAGGDGMMGGGGGFGGGGAGGVGHHHHGAHAHHQHSAGRRALLDPSPCLFKSITPAW
jgi:predicted glutamine amidotransferase